METKTIIVGGMTCVNCQHRIENALRAVAGVTSAAVSYNDGKARITFDPAVCSVSVAEDVIVRVGYSIGRSPYRTVVLLLIIVATFALMSRFGILNILAPTALDNTYGNAAFVTLFVVGVVTSVHCVAMCGGINLSQCINQEKTFSFKPAFLYNAGRVIAYTVVGFVLGLAGMAFRGDFPIFAQGILKLLAGAFMVLFGLNMLGIFPALRRLQPRFPKIVSRSNAPFAVGLLNGLMPCGPLQSMQIVALASGNPFVGALSMFAFSMGTVPLMLGFGSVVTILGKRFSATVTTVGALLVVILGLAMVSQGGALSGLFALDRIFVSNKDVTQAVTIGDRQLVNTTLLPGSYPNITVRVGTSVQWILDAPEGSINGCNNVFHIQEYGITNYAIQDGENVIEFFPDKVGTFRYSCWMGMIHGTINVIE